MLTRLDQPELEWQQRLLRQASRRQVDTKGRDGLRKYRLQGPNVANDDSMLKENLLPPLIDWA